MSQPTLNLIVIHAKSPAKSLEFYRALGLEFVPERHGSGAEYFACDMGALVFEIYPRTSGDDSLSFASPRLGFQFPAIEQVLERLEKLGVKPISGPKKSLCGRRAIVADPDGFRVELTERT